MAQTLIRYDDNIIREICKKIASSPDATEFGRKALIWLIQQSDNLSRLVYTETTDSILGHQMSMGIHNMNSSNGRTILSKITGRLGVKIFFCGWSGGNGKDEKPIYTGRVMLTPMTELAELDVIPFDPDAINAINLADFS